MLRSNRVCSPGQQGLIVRRRKCPEPRKSGLNPGETSFTSAPSNWANGPEFSLPGLQNRKILIFRGVQRLEYGEITLFRSLQEFVGGKISLFCSLQKRAPTKKLSFWCLHKRAPTKRLSFWSLRKRAPTKRLAFWCLHTFAVDSFPTVCANPVKKRVIWPEISPNLPE